MNRENHSFSKNSMFIVKGFCCDGMINLFVVIDNNYNKKIDFANIIDSTSL